MREDGFPNIYLRLTDEFNFGRLRAIICSGQAVVLHKLAVMSKDGDWILREDEESLSHILTVLEKRGATYRFGAPLDLRWLAGGWSAHFEFHGEFRVRTDFFTRPPRLTDSDLRRIWTEQEDRRPPFIGPSDLALMKQTNREKDYVVIGELARIMESHEAQFLHSRSARDLCTMFTADGELALRLVERRPLLGELARGEERVAQLLDEERRQLIRKNEERLRRHDIAAQEWKARWPQILSAIQGMPLRKAHALVVGAALGVLPFHVGDTDHG